VSRLSLLSANLTLSECSSPVLAGRVVVGVVIRNAEGNYVAWSKRSRVGEYATAIGAERAVRAERAAQKKKKATAP
jgi:hypothetical protein